MQIEIKNMNTPILIKSITEDGAFSGYASIFDYVDSHNDVIKKGAFERTLKANNSGRLIKLLWQHDADKPIGVFTRMQEDDKGLYVEGKLLLDLQQAREALSLIQSEAINGLSIGFKVRKSAKDQESGVRYIYNIDLFEVSLVTFPANDKAVVGVVKLQDNKKLEKKLISSGQLIKLSDRLEKAMSVISD